jgi:hypothetical protein
MSLTLPRATALSSPVTVNVGQMAWQSPHFMQFITMSSIFNNIFLNKYFE